MLVILSIGCAVAAMFNESFIPIFTLVRSSAVTVLSIVKFSVSDDCSIEGTARLGDIGLCVGCIVTCFVSPGWIGDEDDVGDEPDDVGVDGGFEAGASLADAMHE